MVGGVKLTSHMDIAIKVENLSKCYQIYDKPSDRLLQMLVRNRKQYYREFWALKDVSFEVKKGESVGILGRNGSGKSTLLQMICGTLNPSYGSVTTNGRIAALLELGSGFNPEFSGRENVYMNGILLGLTKEQIDDRFDAIASFADIGDFIEQPIKTYSSGMLIRLAFAVQVQVEPDILIVDEALSVGDALFQKRCFQTIEKLLADGTTLLFVSHDQESVRTLTHHALLLKHGRSVASGLSSEVVLEYRKQLYDDESEYFSQVAKKISEKNLNTLDKSVESNLNSKQDSNKQLRSEKLSFGDGGVKVIKSEVLNKKGEKCAFFYPGEELKIRITCHASIQIEKLNVAVRLRNKEGVKMYSWGTLNQDIVCISSQSKLPIFWNKKFAANEVFTVEFSCQCPLGINLYEIQSSVSYEETPDYMGQRILHWVDEAAFFQVSMKRDEYFFGGVIDMKMLATWDVNDKF